MIISTISVTGARHAYDVEVGTDEYVRVKANNRAQATRFAERAGYVVRSVNMIG